MNFRFDRPSSVSDMWASQVKIRTLAAALATFLFFVFMPVHAGMPQIALPALSPRSQTAEVLALLSADAQQVRRWATQGGNAQGLPFAVIDKPAATLHVFDALGELLASTPVLLGLARGDHSVPGIGERKMSTILPHERTTPAGRFVSEPGRNLQGEDIVWIEYDTAISLHRVRTSQPAERRLQRLASSTAADNRISYGCVNVPAAFYDRYVAPVWGRQAGVVYVLPDGEPAASFFGYIPFAPQ